MDVGVEDVHVVKNLIFNICEYDEDYRSLLPYISTVDLRQMVNTILYNMAHNIFTVDFTWECVKSLDMLFIQFYCTDMREIHHMDAFTGTFRNLTTGKCHPIYWNFRVCFKDSEEFNYLTDIVLAA